MKKYIFTACFIAIGFAIASCGNEISHKRYAYKNDDVDTNSTIYNVADVTYGGNLILRGGSVIDIKKMIITKRDIYICKGLIVDENDGKECSAKSVDVTGKWLIPGLTDMHIHARGQSRVDGYWVKSKTSGQKYYETYFDDMTPRQVATNFIKSGVTTIVDVMNDEKIIFPARDAQRAKNMESEADIFCSGGAFTPTGGHGTEYGLPTTSYHIVDNPGQAVSELNKITLNKPDVIKIFYDHRGADGGPQVADGEAGALGVAMRKDVMETLVKTAISLGLKPYVHIGVWDDARDAINAGARLITHLGELSSIPKDIVESSRDKNVYWVPTAALYQEMLNFRDNRSLLNDQLLQKVANKKVIDSYKNNIEYYLSVDPYYKAFQERHIGYDKESIMALRNAGVKIMASTDAVELGIIIGWSLHREMKIFTEYGMSNWEALSSATIVPGEFLGRKFGLDTGDEGNIVVLNASPIDDIWNTTKIDKVIHHGAVVKQDKSTSRGYETQDDDGPELFIWDTIFVQ